jgi:uncharacterized protein YndB with AHSA1/START domain
MTTTNGSKLTVTLPSDREIRLEREFSAPRALVYDAMSKPEHMSHWLGPRGYSLTSMEADLRTGGAWRFVHRDPNGNDFAFRGEFREIEPPSRLVRTFEWEGLPGHVSVETLTLEDLDRGARTRMIVTSLFDSVEDRDGMLQSGMERGASESYDQLAEYLATLA